MKTRAIHFVIFCIAILAACDSSDPEPTAVNYIDITTDKATYLPGDDVVFTLAESPGVPVKARFKYLGETLDEISVSGTTFTWTPPGDDLRGYMAELIDASNNDQQVIGTIAFDVSTNWTKFPRYGFLSQYPEMNSSAMEAIVKNLARHHINGVQFYQWAEKYHKPLAGTVDAPSAQWFDISNRSIFKTTLENYIALVHKYNMKAMSYNPGYGALNDASFDGVQEDWYAYYDSFHWQKVAYDRGNIFTKSAVYVMDASNTGWQSYMASRMSDVYAVFDFDGNHVDQFGDRGFLYDYNGTGLDQPSTFSSFSNAMKAADPSKYLVFNAWNQYGQWSNIATSSVDFLYSEIDGVQHSDYAALADVVKDNYTYSSYTKNSVLAAYVNYFKAGAPGVFNTPSVLYTDAVIFAFGGSHIELGEHMLGREYFPISNLTMKTDLVESMVSYYDFLVAYENLLRDGGQFNDQPVTSDDDKTSITSWPPKIGKIAHFSKRFSSKHVFHLINFTSAATLKWQDNTSIQTTPEVIEDFNIKITVTGAATNVWFASPDFEKGSSHKIYFSQQGNQLTMTIPYIRYWDMIVVEF